MIIRVRSLKIKALIPTNYTLYCLDNININIMIIDNNRDISSLISALLSLKGYRTYKAFTSAESITMLHQIKDSLDVIILDGRIAMEEGGLLISKIKQIESTVKIFTIAENVNDRASILKLGSDDFAIKPISTESIIDKVTELVIKRRTLM